MPAMRFAELASTGSAEMSLFQGLSAGKIRRPLREALAPGLALDVACDVPGLQLQAIKRRIEPTENRPATRVAKVMVRYSLLSRSGCPADALSTFAASCHRARVGLSSCQGAAPP